MKTYTLKDWDGSILFENATLEEIANYFNFENINDEIDLQNAINELYDGMKTPTFIENN